MELLSADLRRSSDTALLAASAAGNGQAFAVFYRRHLPGVLAFLMRETRDPEVSADLAAEVFAAVLLGARRYRAQGDSATPWVLGIARNKLLMSFRRGRVEAQARCKLRFEAIMLEDDDLVAIERVAQDGGTRISELVDGLPEHERDAVRSRVVEERSYDEIAQQLRCSPMVVRKRVSRGLQRLRDQLQEAPAP